MPFVISEKFGDRKLCLDQIFAQNKILRSLFKCFKMFFFRFSWQLKLLFHLSKQRCIFRWLLSSIYQRIICLANAMTEWRRHLGGETKRLDDDDGSGSDVYNMAKRFCEVNLNQNCWSIWVFFSNSLNRMKFSTL